MTALERPLVYDPLTVVVRTTTKMKALELLSMQVHVAATCRTARYGKPPSWGSGGEHFSMIFSLQSACTVCLGVASRPELYINLPPPLISLPPLIARATEAYAARPSRIADTSR